MPKSCDVAIIGGGIVGLATAYAVSQQWPEKRIVVLEKEDGLLMHQSGRNSGVIHSGVYYMPGSLKARLCKEGRERLVAFCDREDVPYEICGKVIVAVTEEERPRLQAIYDRGRRNGITCELIGPARLRELEPHVEGVKAIHVLEAGIIDYRAVGEGLAAILEARGHGIQTGAEVRNIVRTGKSAVLETTAGSLRTGFAINCAGLYADRVARMAGVTPEVQIVPFRGEYYELKKRARAYCRNLIYPTPDPAFPFLGVHFTRMIDGRVECGPSAVLAFAREGYRLGHVNRTELLNVLTYPGFLRLAARHLPKGVLELAQSLSKNMYLRAARHLIPALEKDDLLEGRAGVRAQAVTRHGEMVDDFLILETARAVHLCNAPSPAATASLAIGRHIAQLAGEQFD